MTISDNNCFAFTPRGVCRAVETGMESNRCPGYVVCKWYRSGHDHKAASNVAMDRIASLPDEVQRHISEKYYDGKTPWLMPLKSLKVY